MAKRKAKPEEDELDGEMMPSILFDETSDIPEIREKMKEIGITGIDEISIYFSRKKQNSREFAYLDTINLSEISNLIDEAKMHWGGGHYRWRVKIRGKWASEHDNLAMPLSGTFTIEGPPVEAGQPVSENETGSDQIGVYRDGMKDALNTVAAMQQNQTGGGVRDMADLMRSMADSAKASIDSSQKQSEQNVNTIMAMMKSTIDVMLNQMKSEREILIQLSNDKTDMMKQQAEKEREMYGMIIDLVRGQDKSIPEKILDGMENMVERFAPPQPGVPRLAENPAAAPSLPPPEENTQEEDGEMRFILDLIKLIDFCRENEVVPTTAARNMMMRLNPVHVKFLIDHLQTTGFDGTIDMGVKVAGTAGMPLADGFRPYAKDVLAAILKLADADKNNKTGNGN